VDIWWISGGYLVDIWWISGSYHDISTVGGFYESIHFLSGSHPTSHPTSGCGSQQSAGQVPRDRRGSFSISGPVEGSGS